MFLRRFLFTCLLVYGYASTAFARQPDDLVSAMTSGDIDKIKSFCEKFVAASTNASLRADEREEAGIYKNAVCTDAYLDSIQEIAPLLKCIQQAGNKLEVWAKCGRIHAGTSC
ncbi:unnamed protein product, partial [Mesorhabditis belari]|uniref:Secreted protein n=1 Tax=Mesorhabditis belari TaxID=2138241 RepID=A0AAF3EHH2_9BILA